jgi:hypothetical protein
MQVPALAVEVSTACSRKRDGAQQAGTPKKQKRLSQNETAFFYVEV